MGRRLRQRRGPGHHRGPQGARPAARRGALRAQLPVLLALRHGPALLRQGDVVHPHHGRQGRAPQGQRGRRLAPGAHQDRALRRVARQQRGLGPEPRPLLGHAPAGVALRARSPALPGLHRGAARAGGRSRPGGSGTPPSLRRRRRPRPAPSVAARCAASRRSSTPGSTPAPCRSPSGTTRSSTRTRSASASRPTSSPRPSTRRGAGSTAFSPWPRWWRAAARTSASSAWGTSSTATARR